MTQTLACSPSLSEQHPSGLIGTPPPPPRPPAVSPLRQRMIDDMTLRRIGQHGQRDYLRAVRNFSMFLGRSPDKAEVADLKRFQLHLIEKGSSAAGINAISTALRFFFKVTVGRPEVVAALKTLPMPDRLPVVLSQDEVLRLLNHAPNLKHRAALSVAYGCGLRVSEICNLKISDIDSQRMLIRVEQGKGRKDRYVMLSEDLLALLRQWWRVKRPMGWLFPGREPGTSVTTRQLDRVVKAAARSARLGRHVSMHTLRHSFATHLLEQKVDIRVIQTLLGHSKIETTTIYTRVALKVISEVESPLSRLKLQDGKQSGAGQSGSASPTRSSG
jgi:integrase/recombinase XerD